MGRKKRREVGIDIVDDAFQIEEILRIKDSAIDSSINAIYIADLDGNLTYVNRSFLKMWGYDKPEELLGKPSVKFWQKKGKSVEIMDALFDLGGWMGELPAERKDGSTFYVRLSASMVTDKAGEPLCMMASFIDITEHKKSEKEVIRTKEYLQSIINSASEIIISVDENNKISTWNKTAERITGYKQKQVIGQSVNRLNVFDNRREILDNIKSIYSGHNVVFDEFILRTKQDTKRIIKSSYSTIKSSDGQFIGVLFVGKDITYERETHGKILKGNSYLISDKSNGAALDLFIDLTKLGHKGLFITRANPEKIKNMLSPADIKTVLLNQEKLGGFENISDFNGVIGTIKDFSTKNKDSVILLDRVDYLLTRFSFEQFVESMYQINDIVSKNHSILLVYLNPSFLDARQMAFIEAELQPLPSQKIEGIEIEDELFDVLRFIYEQNQNNSLVSFKKICREFSIVKSTAAKRIRMLEDNDLVFIKKQGRLKVVYISDKGKTLVNKRQIF